MKIENLKIFMTVARTENMHKAAESNFTSYQNISFIIKNMEKELGFALFTRDNKGMRLTVEGREFLQLVAPFVGAYEEFVIRQSTKGDLPVFHLYTTPVMERYVRSMQDVIYSDYYYCSVKKSAVSEMLEMLSDNQPGIYLIPGFNGISHRIMSQKDGVVLAKDKNIIVCHASNPILHEQVILLETLKKLPTVSSGNYVRSSTQQTLLNIDDIALCKRYMREKSFLYSTTQFIFDVDFTEKEEWVILAENSKQKIEYDLVFNLPEAQLSIARHFFLEPLQELFRDKQD